MYKLDSSGLFGGHDKQFVSHDDDDTHLSLIINWTTNFTSPPF